MEREALDVAAGGDERLDAGEQQTGYLVVEGLLGLLIQLGAFGLVADEVGLHQRIVKGLAAQNYVESARASGAGAWTIVRVHVMPNVLGPVFVYATSLISVSMIIAAGSSFLGLGTKPPEPEWDLMLNTLRTAIYSQPLLTMLPGFCIFATSLCFNLVSDGLRSATDVRA